MLATYYSLWVWFFLLINLFKLEVNYFTIFSAFYHTFQRRQWHPTPVLLPGKSHGWKSLVVCSPCSHKELDTTKQIHFHTSLSCIGEGNGNPLQCSCLENPRDRESWWAAVYEVTQSWTRLKWLSNSSSSNPSQGSDLALATAGLVRGTVTELDPMGPFPMSPALTPLWSTQIIVFDAHFLRGFADVNLLSPTKCRNYLMILSTWSRPPGA